MARFDVYANPTANDRTTTPYVLDVQNNHLGPLATRVVIPLRTAKALATPAEGLNPGVVIDGKPVWLDTASLAPVPAALLRKPVLNLGASSDLVLDALDTLFGSY
jgi:toxin CcdB